MGDGYDVASQQAAAALDSSLSAKEGIGEHDEAGLNAYTDFTSIVVYLLFKKERRELASEISKNDVFIKISKN